MIRAIRDPEKDEGSVPLTIMVVFVVTFLVVGLLLVSQSSLKFSRRAGDSANALQVADAGVNDAIKALVAHVNDTRFELTTTLGVSGTYHVIAAKDATKAGTWHIDSTGVDPTGVKRHVLADGVDQPLFSAGFFGFKNVSVKGTADSFTGYPAYPGGNGHPAGGLACSS